jgi:hypothetical protein
MAPSSLDTSYPESESIDVILPTIHLDATLASLYANACPFNKKPRIGQVLCGVSAVLDLSPDFPRNTKFLYQDSLFNSAPTSQLVDSSSGITQDGDRSQAAAEGNGEEGSKQDLQKSLAMKYLSLVPQRDAFISGSTSVILFNVDQDPKQIAHDKTEAETTLAVLADEQRPELLFCLGPPHIPRRQHGIDRIAYKVALDQLDRYPLTVDLETAWFLNSKAALAGSGLPTPRAEVIEVIGMPLSGHACCDDCREDGPEALLISMTCNAARGTWLKRQTGTIVSRIRARPPPFVVKSQQTFGGAGTWVVADQKAKESLISEFEGEHGFLRRLLSRVTTENQHLRPASLVISDMVKDPIGDYGVTMFVKEGGGFELLGVSQQQTDEGGAWIGSEIDYGRQDELKEKFSDIISQIAAWLAAYGYYGPAGADILESQIDKHASQNDESSSHPEQLATHFDIVDLNVRTSGSLCLPLLRSHFTSRDLQHASSFSVTVEQTRREYVKRWHEEFESGQMCVLSWYEDKRSGKSIADVAIGGHDAKDLQRLMKVVREESEDVTF